MSDEMPDKIWATPKGSGTMSGVYVDSPYGDEPRGEYEYIRADLYESVKAERDELLGCIKNIETKCEKIADQKLHADVAIFGMYTSIQNVLKKAKGQNYD